MRLFLLETVQADVIKLETPLAAFNYTTLTFFHCFYIILKS